MINKCPWAGSYTSHALISITGIATVGGIVALVIIFPINVYIARRQHGIQKYILKMKDKRVRLLNEMLNGIKVSPLYIPLYILAPYQYKIMINDGISNNFNNNSTLVLFDSQCVFVIVLKAKDLKQSSIQSAQILRACGEDYIYLTTVLLKLNKNLAFNAPN